MPFSKNHHLDFLSYTKHSFNLQNFPKSVLFCFLQTYVQFLEKNYQESTLTKMLYFDKKPITVKIRNWMHSSLDTGLQYTVLWSKVICCMQEILYQIIKPLTLFEIKLLSKKSNPDWCLQGRFQIHSSCRKFTCLLHLQRFVISLRTWNVKLFPPLARVSIIFDCSKRINRWLCLLLQPCDTIRPSKINK